METLLYLVKVNAYWLVFYACYWPLLRKHTFFRWNRFYLLGTLLIAFALPAIRFTEPPRGRYYLRLVGSIIRPDRIFA